MADLRWYASFYSFFFFFFGCFAGVVSISFRSSCVYHCIVCRQTHKHTIYGYVQNVHHAFQLIAPHVHATKTIYGQWSLSTFKPFRAIFYCPFAAPHTLSLSPYSHTRIFILIKTLHWTLCCAIRLNWLFDGFQALLLGFTNW